jgi:hypothetical protein
MKPDFLHTDRRENFRTWRFRTIMNWYPMYFGTGGKVLFWSADSQEVHLRLRLSMWTYNYVGTIYGGSFFSASDPFYMLMLMQILGKEYVVWDKSASIRYRRPGKSTLYANLVISSEMIGQIKQEVAEKGETDFKAPIQWKDKAGVVHAEIERVVYIADKAFFKQKKGL